MNKIIIVIIIAVIIGIGVTTYSLSMDSTKNEVIQVEDELIPVEEVPIDAGKSLTVELTESIGLETP